jgi:hypothetical protein
MAEFRDPVEGECQICAEFANRLCSAEDRATRATAQMSRASDPEVVRLAMLDFVYGRSDADEVRRQWREHRLAHAPSGQSNAGYGGG